MTERPPKVSLQNPSFWSARDGVKFSGEFYYKDKLHSTEETFAVFDEIENPSQLSEIMSDVSGKFSIIIQNGEELFFAHAPSGAAVPLFHTSIGDGFVSDNYYKVENILQPQPWNPILGVELLSRGEIWGKNTLHPNVYKITRGMLVSFSSESSSFECQRYYDVYQTEKSSNDQQQIFDELSSVLDSIFSRLKQRANTEPILLGLSGGYDSRLLALMLKRHEFDRVFAYTVNTQSSYDMDVAERLADQLDFEWIPIEHTHRKIQQMYKSNIWWDIEELTGGYGIHCPIPSSLVTYSTLSELEIHPNEGILLFGLTPADGIHIPRFMIEQSEIQVDKVAKYIVDDECSYMPLKDRTTDTLAARISDWIPFDGSVSNSTAIDILTNFYIHKHHFGGSTLRADYFGYKNYYPFQDPDFFDFYASLPVEQKYERNCLENFTEQLNQKLAPTVPIGGGDSAIQTMAKNKLKDIIIGSPLEIPIRTLKRMIESNVSDSVDEYAIKYGFLSETMFDEVHTGECHYRYYLGRDALSQSRSGPTDHASQ